MGGRCGVGVGVNGDGVADYRIKQGYGGHPVGAPAMGMGMPGRDGYGVDVNRDGIPDYKVRPGVGVDVNGDGVADYRTAPKVTRGPGMNMGMGYRPYGY